MACNAVFPAAAARVLVLMQLLRVTLALSTSSSISEAHYESKSRSASIFLDRGNHAQPELPDLSKYNDQILALHKKIDSLTLQCKKTELKDKETLGGLERELRLVSGQLAANLAQQSAAQTAADQDKAQTVKLKAQLVNVASMCQTQKEALNSTLEMLLADQERAKSLRGLSDQCGPAALMIISSSTIANSTAAPVSLMQGCVEGSAHSMVAAGDALMAEADKFLTPSTKKAFREAVQKASTSLPLSLTAEKAWPSKQKPPSKAKAKAANACKLSGGAVNCNQLKSQLDALAKRIEEQRDAAVTNQRRGIRDCENKEKQVNDRIKSSDAQHARSSAELVRLTGVKAGLAATRAAVVQRLERSQRDAKKFTKTCNSGADDYKGRLEDVLRARQKAANGAAGEKIAIQDCKVTDWKFSKCSKACKKNEDDAPGTMEATRETAAVPGLGGASCPPLSAKLPCNDKPCPVDCAVSEWAKWSECSKACGGGTTKRSRKVVMQSSNGGKGCPLVEQRKSCNVGRCGDKCKLKPWTPWSACTRRCRFSKNTAAGRQRRTREVDGNPMMPGGENPCPPADDETRFQSRTCNTDICPKGITCDASQDLLFFIDASGDAAATYHHQASLVTSIAKRSSQKVHVGAIAYGKDVQIISRITADRNQLAALNNHFPAAGGSRDAAKAEVIGRSLFADPGVGGGRPKTAVLLLGGAPSGFPEAKKAAKELRSANVRIVVGLLDDGSQLARDQACSIATSPCEANVEAFSSWEELAAEPGRFIASLCRTVVYPNADPAQQLAGGGAEAENKEKAANGDLGAKQMPKWMKRQLGLK